MDIIFFPVLVTSLPRDLSNICESYLEPNEQKYYNNEWDKFPHNNVCNIAAKYGWMDLLIWIREKTGTVNCPWDRWTCAYAAKYGHKHILKYLYEHGCPWDTLTYACAAGGGHMDILKFLHNNKCPWNSMTYNYAARNGHLDILKYLHENGVKHYQKNNCYYGMMMKPGMRNVLKYYQKRESEWNNNAYNDKDLLKMQHHFNLTYLTDYGWDNTICGGAALNGHFNIIQYIVENKRTICTNEIDCYKSEYICAFAARRGNLDILKYLHENGFPWNEWTCSSAAKKGRLDILIYAKQNNCPWNHWTCHDAIKNNHLDVLIYAERNNCPWITNACELAKKYKYENILEWLCNNKCDCNGKYH